MLLYVLAQMKSERARGVRLRPPHLGASCFRMPDWSQACSAQFNRPQWQLQHANYAGCLCAVASFATAAMYSGLWLRRWATGGVKNRMWGQLGWFCALVCVGSVVGAIGWGAQMQTNSLYYESFAPANTRRDNYALLASAARWFACFLVLYPVEFLCFILPKLMLLARLTAQISQANASLAGRAQIAIKALMAALVLCSLAGILANVTAAAYFVQLAGLQQHAADFCYAQGSDTNSSLAFIEEGNAVRAKAYTAASVQGIFEAIALLLIALAFVVVVIFSIAMFRRAERVGNEALLSATTRLNTADRRTATVLAIVDDTVRAAAEQRQRLVVACTVVLVTFPARAAVDLLNSYASFNDPYNPACTICGPCQSLPYLIKTWLIYTPEFQPIIVTLSSPLPLVVSLWIITQAHTRAFGIAFNVLRARLGRDVPRQPTAPTSHQSK